MNGNVRRAREFLETHMKEIQEKRFTENEAIEVLMEAAMIRKSLDVLEAKAEKDLDYHLQKPKLRVIE